MGGWSEPAGTVKTKWLNPRPEILIQEGWEGLRMHTSRKFPGDADAAGLGP